MADPTEPVQGRISLDDLVKHLTGLIAAGRAAEVLAFAHANPAALESSAAIVAVVADAASVAGRPDEAEALLRKIVQAEPAQVGAWTRLTVVLLRQDRLEEAIAACRQALELDPNLPAVRHNLSFALLKLGRFAEAETEARQALALQSDYGRARYTLALSLLSQGKFEEGFAAFEARLDPVNAGGNSPPPPVSYPRWSGEPLDGKSILVWSEQGLGDEIMMARYGAVLRAMGAARVSLFCRPPLASLFQSLPGVDAVYPTQGEISLPPHDYWVYPMSLPRLCGARLDDAAWPGPYLEPSDQVRAAWRDLTPEGLGVGLVWSGKANHANDKHRSLPGREALAPLWAAPGVEFYSLQKDRPVGAAAVAGQPLTDLAPRLTDFEQTAAAIERLDLVITVDTAVAHLAGALGKPCFVMLPAIGLDWRWGAAGSATPWYPTVTLFRQATPGDWEPVVAEMAAALAERAGARR